MAIARGCRRFALTNVRPKAGKRIGLDFPAVTAAKPRRVYGLITVTARGGRMPTGRLTTSRPFWARSALAHLLTRPGDTPPFQSGGMGDHWRA